MAVSTNAGKGKSMNNVKPFPKLMRNLQGDVWLFYNQTTGTKLSDVTPTSPYEIGWHGQGVNANAGSWEDYNEPVMLKNL